MERRHTGTKWVCFLVVLLTAVTPILQLGARPGRNDVDGLVDEDFEEFEIDMEEGDVEHADVKSEGEEGNDGSGGPRASETGSRTFSALFDHAGGWCSLCRVRRSTRAVHRGLLTQQEYRSTVFRNNVELCQACLVNPDRAE